MLRRDRQENDSLLARVDVNSGRGMIAAEAETFFPFGLHAEDSKDMYAV
jgi:hypothetical protein